jgi:hypothetical protein
MFYFYKKQHAMLKNYFTVSAFLATSIASAQITITSSDMPAGGESILTSISTGIGSVDPALTGPNYNWDFSTLTPSAQRLEVFTSGGAFTSPYNLLYGIFAGASAATYGKDNFTIGLLPIPGFTITSAYDFYKKSSSSLKQVGLAYTINDSIPLPFEYSLADITYKFPMNYSNTDSCNFKFGPHHLIPSGSLPFYYGGSGKRVNKVDGWGTLITPFGTFSTLRIKSVITETDTMNVSGTGLPVPIPERIEYKWLAAGKKVPVLQIDQSAGITTSVIYLDSLRQEVPYIGIAEVSNAKDFSVYPNPSSSDVTVSFSLTTSSKVKISVTNTIGQAKSIIANKSFSEGRQTISVNVNELNLAPGIYFVNLESDGGRSVKKLVITK